MPITEFVDYLHSIIRDEFVAVSIAKDNLIQVCFAQGKTISIHIIEQ